MAVPKLKAPPCKFRVIGHISYSPTCPYLVKDFDTKEDALCRAREYNADNPEGPDEYRVYDDQGHHIRN